MSGAGLKVCAVVVVVGGCVWCLKPIIVFSLAQAKEQEQVKHQLFLLEILKRLNIAMTNVGLSLKFHYRESQTVLRLIFSTNLHGFQGVHV